MSRGLGVWFYIGLMAATLTLAGCGAGASSDKTEYLLDPRREQEPVAASPDAVLEVRRFMIDSAFSGKGLVYRTGDLQYESDFHNEFLVAPVTLIREAARNWFAQSNLFERVADPGSYVEPTFALEGNVTALYGDVRDKSAPQAVVELRAFFLKVRGSRDPMMIHSKTYTATRNIEEQDPSGLVAALNQCLQTILTDLETDVAAQL